MITQKGFTPEELDIKNEDIKKRGGIRFYNIKSEPFTIHGLYDPKNGADYIRLPLDVAEATSPSVKGLNYHTAGGRVRFRTSSNYVALKVVTRGSAKMTNMCLIGSSAFDVYVARGGVDTFAAIFNPPYDYKEGYESIVGLPAGDKDITINFPLYSGVMEVYLGLDKSSSLERRADYKFTKPVLYYGSSITQGGCASRPGLAYESLISRRLDTDYINFGFSGSAKAEDAICNYMASLDYSVFVSDYDHNAPSSEYLAQTHEKLYKTIRAAHPDVPVVFVGRPDFWLTVKENPYRRDVIYTTYKNALERGEKVLFVDGYSLFHGDLREECTVDGCHPNDLGMARMADMIGKAVEFALTM